MRSTLVVAVMFYTLIGWRPASAACTGAPYDQFDFWVGAWHDTAAPAGEHYVVRRSAAGCAIEEVLIGANGQSQGIGLAGWDSERRQWRQLWADADKVLTVYVGGPAPGETFVLTSEPKDGGKQWRYTYRDIRPERIKAEYALREGEGGGWITVWSGQFERIRPD